MLLDDVAGANIAETIFASMWHNMSLNAILSTRSLKSVWLDKDECHGHLIWVECNHHIGTIYLVENVAETNFSLKCGNFFLP